MELIEYEDYQDCVQDKNGKIATSTLENLLKMTKEDAKELEKSWYETYKNNEEIFYKNRDIVKEKGNVLLEMLRNDFPKESLTPTGKMKSKYQKIVDVQVLEVENKKPKPPIIDNYVYSEKAKEDIKINMHSGSVFQWFDITRYQYLYNEKEKALLKENDKKLKQLKLEELKENKKLQEDVKKCQDYIISQGGNTDNLETLKALESIATQLRIDELINEQLEDTGNNILIKNICSDCDSWDGVSRRCSCGNRRMYWESDGDFLKDDIFVYPMAD